jgi:hypothetical protein
MASNSSRCCSSFSRAARSAEHVRVSPAIFGGDRSWWLGWHCCWMVILALHKHLIRKLGSLEPRFWLVALQQGDQELLIGFWILGAKNRRRAAQAVQSHQFGCGRFFLLLVHCFNHIVCSFSCCERTLGENPLGGHHLLLRGTAYPAGAGQQLACHPDARGRSQA